MSTLNTADITSGVAVNDVCIKWKMAAGTKNKRPSSSSSLLVFHNGKINSIYKLQLHPLLSMPAIHTVNESIGDLILDQ